MSDQINQYDLAVVIPTYNEKENISILLERLESVLSSINYQVVVVDDDSPDLTWQVVEEFREKNNRVSVIRRLGAKGLSSAVTTGLLESNANVMAVMDADLQHDEAILPAMFEKIAYEQFDVCVGSRDAPGGSYGEWSTKRKIVSWGARWLADVSLGSIVRDPMSGFFAISKEYVDNTIDAVNPSGFKILLEFLARGNKPKVCEVGYTFRTRIHGNTKLNASVAVEYLLALIDLRFGWLVPNQFVKFGIVGFFGSLVNLLGFAISQAFDIGIPFAILIGIELSIVFTYTANNFFTFTPMTFRGKDFFLGLGLYQLVCGYGLVVQFSVVQTLLMHFPFMKDRIITLYLVYLAGVLFAAVGNFFLHTYYTWNRLGFATARPTRSNKVSLSHTH